MSRHLVATATSFCADLVEVPNKAAMEPITVGDIVTYTGYVLKNCPTQWSRGTVLEVQNGVALVQWEEEVAFTASGGKVHTGKNLVRVCVSNLSKKMSGAKDAYLRQ